MTNMTETTSEKLIDNSKNINMDYYWNKKTIVSFILSIFVVFIHMSSFSQYQYEGTPLFEIVKFTDIFFRRSLVVVATPMFFLISGATMFRNYKSCQYKEKLVSKAKTLLIPFLCWNILNMLFSIGTSYSFVSNYFIGRPKFVMSVSNILLSVFFYKCNGPFWFIFNLMIFTLATPVINILVSKKSIGFFSICALILLQAVNIKLPETIFFDSSSVIYYITGCFIGRHYFDSFKSKASEKKQIFGVIVAVAITVVRIMVAYKVFVLPKAADTIVFIAYSLSLWILSDMFVGKVKLRPYMKDSYMIYAMHLNTSAIIIKLFYLVFPKTPIMAILNFVVCSALTVVVICLLCKFLNKFFSRGYKVLSGAR